MRERPVRVRRRTGAGRVREERGSLGDPTGVRVRRIDGRERQRVRAAGQVVCRVAVEVAEQAAELPGVSRRRLSGQVQAPRTDRGDVSVRAIRPIDLDDRTTLGEVRDGAAVRQCGRRERRLRAVDEKFHGGTVHVHLDAITGHQHRDRRVHRDRLRRWVRLLAQLDHEVAVRRTRTGEFAGRLEVEAGTVKRPQVRIAVRVAAAGAGTRALRLRLLILRQARAAGKWRLPVRLAGRQAQVHAQLVLGASRVHLVGRQAALAVRSDALRRVLAAVLVFVRVVHLVVERCALVGVATTGVRVPVVRVPEDDRRTQYRDLVVVARVGRFLDSDRLAICLERLEDTGRIAAGTVEDGDASRVRGGDITGDADVGERRPSRPGRERDAAEQ